MCDRILSKSSSVFIGLILVFIITPLQLYAADKERYIFGVFPYVSPAQLVKFHTPLKKKMEAILGKPVSLISAPSFKEFIKRTKLQKYDFIMTAPHLGRLAEVRDKYQPMVHTMHKVQGIYLVKNESPIKSLSDLKGKTISGVGRAAIITQMAIEQLTGAGFEIGKDIKFKMSKNHNTSMYAPLRGETDASVTGIVIWGKITTDEELKKKMRVIGKTKIAPGFMLMANEEINKNTVNEVRSGLVEYNSEVIGKQYIDSVGFVAFKEAEKDVMENLDPYTTIFMDKK